MAGKKAGFLCIAPAVRQGINSLAGFGVFNYSAIFLALFPAPNHPNTSKTAAKRFALYSLALWYSPPPSGERYQYF